MSGLTVTHLGYDGSSGERVILAFDLGLTQKQKDFVVDQLQICECKSYIKDVRWRTNKVLVVEVWRNTINDCSRVDIVRIVERITPRIPTPVLQR